MILMVVGDKGARALFQGKEDLMRSNTVCFTGISSAFKNSALNNLGAGESVSLRVISLVLIEEQPRKIDVINNRIKRISSTLSMV
jgi:hypothetical protein